MLANTVDGKVRSTALSRWSQFVALTVSQLNGRQSFVISKVSKHDTHKLVLKWFMQVFYGSGDNGLPGSYPCWYSSIFVSSSPSRLPAESSTSGLRPNLDSQLSCIPSPSESARFKLATSSSSPHPTVKQ